MKHIADERLQAFLDGELDRAGKSRVSKHLSACPDCEGRLRAMQGLYALIESVPEHALPADLAAEVVARLSPLPALGGRIRWLLLAELGLGVGSLTAALSWLGWSPTAWSDAFSTMLHTTLDLSEAAIWFASLQASIQTGLTLVETFSDSTTTPLVAALPVTGWAVLLAAIVIAGLGVNGWILSRAGHMRSGNGRSA